MKTASYYKILSDSYRRPVANQSAALEYRNSYPYPLDTDEQSQNTVKQEVVSLFPEMISKEEVNEFESRTNKEQLSIFTSMLTMVAIGLTIMICTLLYLLNLPPLSYLKKLIDNYGRLSQW